MTARRPGRPPVLKDPVSVNFEVERDLLDKVDATATARGISRSAVIRAAIRAAYADGDHR